MWYLCSMTISTKDLHLEGEIERRQISETNLANANEIFGLLVNAVEDYAIFALDTKGNILTWNAGGRRLKGYSRDEIIGRNFSIFYTPEDIARQHPQHELEIAKETGRYEEEGWRVKKDGARFWASIVITALHDANGHKGFAKVTRNLTERKMAEDALKASYSELELRVQQRTFELAEAKARAERAVASRDQFFSMASHELKTPLSSLKLQTQLRKRSVLAGDLSDFAPEKLVELCDDDERQINRLAYLVENMLDISKVTSGVFSLNLQNVNLFAILAGVIKVMGPSLAETKNICTLNCQKSIYGRWDQTRIEQVFTNLLSNCGKYAAGMSIDITAVEENNIVKIQVQDSGPGIPKEKLNKIFDPFERLNVSEATGLGLGLYIVKQIVEAHHGDVRVDSEVRKGTTFTISLPLVQVPVQRRS